jgi:hypothetical protein
MYPFSEIENDNPVTSDGIYYMASPPQAIDAESAGHLDYADYRRRRGAVAGSVFDDGVAMLEHLARGGLNLAERGGSELLSLAERGGRGLLNAAEHPLNTLHSAEQLALAPVHLLERGGRALLDVFEPHVPDMSLMAPRGVSGCNGIDELVMRGDLDPEVGFSLRHLVHDVTQPIRSVANVAEQAATVPFQLAERVAMTPLRLLQAAGNKLPGAPGGGTPAAAPDAAAAPDPSATDPGDGEGDPTMNADASGSAWRQGQNHAHRHQHHKPRTHVMGFQMSDYLPSFMKSKPAAKLLVSAVPGGATAMEAHDIANKALADGSLNPTHVTMASKLLKLAHLGHKPSIAKIAKLKQSAGRGDPHAEVAVDRLKLVHSIQNGSTTPQTATGLGQLRRIGLATLDR